MRRITINDADRQQWIENDEGLYLWWKSTRLPIRRFIRENREELTKLINKAMGRG